MAALSTLNRTRVAALLLVALAVPPTRRALLGLLHDLLRILVRRLAVLHRPALRKDFLRGGRAQDVDNFDDLQEILPPWLTDGLRSQGFRSLKPIQRKVLPLALAGKDVIGLAPTGSGKTLAFLVPGAVHAAGQSPPRRLTDGPIMLVLAPTRELAVQIGVVAERLIWTSWGPEGRRTDNRGRNAGPEGLQCATIYGGTRKMDQLHALRREGKIHILVATPGRLLDLMNNHKAFSLKKVSFFVLDEGDRMLDMGFEEDVGAISAEIRPDRQMLFFSATWPQQVERAARRLCCKNSQPEIISVQPPKPVADVNANGQGGLALPPREIRQLVEVIDTGSTMGTYGATKKKLPLLLQHLEQALGKGQNSKGKALVFVQTRLAAEDIGGAVANHFGLHRCGIMHGLKPQNQREQTLRDFRDGRLRALVATDVVGRGLDVPGVTHVVIFDMPSDIETYVHRVGRTGRNGHTGTSVAFFEPAGWNGYIAAELASVLRACGQEVPQALQLEEELALAGRSWNSGIPGAGGEPWSSWSPPASAPAQPPAGLPARPTRAPPAARVASEGDAAAGQKTLATREELGAWHADGARCWGYSANGGQSEQGRLEFYAGGSLRTTWGWGQWKLRPNGDMDLSWNGISDTMQLDATGLGFELVERNGRAATAFRNKTLGTALPGSSF